MPKSFNRIWIHVLMDYKKQKAFLEEYKSFLRLHDLNPEEGDLMR